jgi:hypothetical protein
VPTDWLPKERLEGVRLIVAAVPVPESPTVCGLPLALSAMLTEAARLPLAEGVKVTLIVHFTPGATELPQLLLWAKSPAFAPVNLRLVMVNVALPLLVKVTAWATLVVPTGWFPKERLVEERLTTGIAPVPERPIA